MIRINLIKDRVVRPPSVAERLSPAFPVLLFLVYVFTVGLYVLISFRASHNIRLLKAQVKNEQLLAKKVDAHIVGYTPGDLKDIEALRRVSAVLSSKWHWGLKLESLQESMPEGITITFFKGEAKKNIQIRAAAANADGQGLERIREFARKLQQNSVFMRGLKEVNWKTMTTPTEKSKSGGLDFELECVAGS